MSNRYSNKIVFEEDGQSHPFIDMEGEEQVSYNLENDAVRNYLRNVTYSKSDIITSSNQESTVPSKVMPYFRAKAHRYPWGTSESAWSETTRPVVIYDTKVGDIIEFTSLDHTMGVDGTNGATLVYNLVPRRFYSYTIKRAGNVIKTGYFNTEGQCRMIKIQMPNYRDIGGWKCENGTISYNKIFRGCAYVGNNAGKYVNIASVSTSQKNAIISELIDLGVTIDLDLRVPGTEASNPGYGSSGITYKNIGFTHYTINSKTVETLQYISNALSNGEVIWTHCWTAADRAGTLIAIIQILLGCDIDSIIKEWELSMFHGPGYEETYLNGPNVAGFRTMLYNLYNSDRSKTLKENTITALKNNKPSGITNSDVDVIVQNLNNKLVTKTMAIIGDSYSAYTGSGPKVEIEGYKNTSVYAGEYPTYAMPVNKIWWAQVAQHLGLNAVNYSWSGCTVTPAEGVDIDERVCSSDARIDRLSYLLGGNAPDIVFCAIGYNDANAIANGNRYGITLAKLEAAYRSMLDKIVARYPDARIYCLNNVQRSSSGDRFNSYKAFNTRLASIVNDYPNATLVDVANVFNNTYSGNTVSDATHPNETGFTKIANRVIALIEPDFSDNSSEGDEEEVISYAFVVNHCSSRGFTSGSSEYGYQKQADNYVGWEFAEFPVSAGDVVQVGTNDGVKLATCFAESENGFLDAMNSLPYGQMISSGWYSGCFNYSYTGANTIVKNGRTMICQQYTVQHGGILTVALKVNDSSVSARGGSYVFINGTAGLRATTHDTPV